MGNPYLQPQNDTQPETEPKLSRAPSLAVIALLVAIAGLFLPGDFSFDKLPIPIPPYIDPKPIVDPADTEGSWVVVIEQTEQRTLETAAVLRDTAYWQSLEKRGLNWRHYDYDAPEAAVYRKLADDVGMPAVAIILGKGDVGKVLGKFKLTTKNELDAKIKEATAR